MTIDFDRSQAPSPRESMHSELLLELTKASIPSSARHRLGHTFEFAGWLKLNNTHDLPALLIMEEVTARGVRWYLIDTARVRNLQGIVLMSGRVESKETQIKSLHLYICHPNPDIRVEVEELRFNGELVRKDYIDGFTAAS